VNGVPDAREPGFTDSVGRSALPDGGKPGLPDSGTNPDTGSTCGARRPEDRGLGLGWPLWWWPAAGSPGSTTPSAARGCATAGSPGALTPGPIRTLGQHVVPDGGEPWFTDSVGRSGAGRRRGALVH